MKITILTDDRKSWFVPYARLLLKRLALKGHSVRLIFSSAKIRKCDVCFLLSCTGIVSEDKLRLNKHNIVVHASDLPKGRGFSPLQWQILEGKKRIPLTLFEAVKELDAGPYYIKDFLMLDGSELYDELKKKLGDKVIRMCLAYISKYDSLIPVRQKGRPTFYPRRTKKDDRLDIHKSIADQFNRLRIANNRIFPAYFIHKGQTYVINIYKERTRGSNE
jgi:methionyl-tRNA formyltransferase